MFFGGNLLKTVRKPEIGVNTMWVMLTVQGYFMEFLIVG